ncbi:hypothetical protein CHS0354_032487 [Potamilus streckersoni]|uniref:Peptidase S9 prolyl oligopeptidase catalytic domain-containing protein n=1 Tax=Potamilus streckersoni TaxID=2493646 RepID=A0AAE0SPS4_9BIVA|nr:hypothetical protein CHS0354_032487 [Potamilus streckersoni]
MPAVSLTHRVIYKVVNIATVQARTLSRYFTNMSAAVSSYGTWKSPISSQLVSESSVNFQEVRTDLNSANADTVYWTELRYDEGGRYVVCSQKSGEPKFQSLTPAGFNARTRVHEYGGGATMVYDGAVYFSNFADQRMYVQSSTMEAPEPVTEEGTFHRFADAEFHPKTGRIYCVREDHSLVEKGQDKEPQNTIVSVNPVNGSMTVLASGADFYSSPRVSPNGKKIAWIQWCHPNMPWDSTELWVGDLNDDGSLILSGTEKQFAGGNDISVMQPSWTAKNELVYISDQTDWWNLYHVTSTGEHVNLLPREQEIGGPQWIFGDPGYQIDPRNNGEIVTIFGEEIGILNMTNGSYRKVETGFKTHSHVSVVGDGTIYCVAGSPTQFPCIIRVNSTSGKVDIIRESKSLELDKGYFSIPETISWNTTDDELAHGYFYPPQNKDYLAPTGELPPLLVKAHGGPTSATTSSLNLKIQYFTSRGFAVLDVDYRGSTGYGKKYRHRLRKNWGVCDVDDSCSGALHLADTGRVDKNRLCIDGSSAGGYTTLACLTFKSVFKAGASHYGIGDLEALAKDTHKFESRYLDTMISPYEEKYYPIYKERSPINHVDKLDCALAIFQGDEDKIVPPNQAEMMYKAVKARGLPTTYVLFKGEQHGFRKAENIQTSLDGEFYFFSKVFGFEAADIDVQMQIDNL